MWCRDCRGAAKAIDGVEPGSNSLAVSLAAASPYMVIDMGFTRADIRAIRIAPRPDNFNESSDLNVYVGTSLTSNLKLAVAGLNIDFNAQTKAIANALVLPGTPVRYIILQRMTGSDGSAGQGVLSIQEVTIMTAGGCACLVLHSSTQCARGHAPRNAGQRAGYVGRCLQRYIDTLRYFSFCLGANAAWARSRWCSSLGILLAEDVHACMHACMQVLRAHQVRPPS